MSCAEVKRLIDLLGEEKFHLLVTSFPNQRIPGTKSLNRLKREQFLREFDGTRVPDFAHKYGVSTTAIYTWLKSSK